MFPSVIPEHVRMTELHLVADLGQRVRDVEAPLLLPYPAIECYMVQQITEFLGDGRGVVLDYRIAELIHFLLGHRAYGFHRLLRIPRTLLAQRVHRVQKTGERRELFLFCVH